MLERFFYKHIVFSWEKETRVVIPLRLAQEFGASVPENGIFVDIDCNELIESIFIGPTLTLDERELVIKSCTKNGFKDRVKLSTLLYKPRYI